MDATIQTVTIIGSVAGLMAIGVSVMLFAMNQFGKRIDDTNRRIDDFRNEISARFDHFRNEINAQFDELRGEIRVLRGEICSVRNEVRSRIRGEIGEQESPS